MAESTKRLGIFFALILLAIVATAFVILVNQPEETTILPVYNYFYETPYKAI